MMAREGAAARRWSLVLEGVTAAGAVAGVQGFVSGQFEPLVAQLPFVDGPMLPAAALASCVAVPQAVALVLGLRRSPRASHAALGVGLVLTGWVLVQLPMIGWGSPVQWVFFAVGLAEVAAAGRWLGSATAGSAWRPGRRRERSLRAGPVGSPARRRSWGPARATTARAGATPR